jgi:8-oxo-dGTP pyrophosphatase MutT (NUDIX family)
MIIDFPIDKESYGEYCPSCHAKDSASATKEDGQKVFICSKCGARNDRLVIIDPKLHWWIDEKKQYWHESAGILLVNPAGKILFYELTKFPYGFTVPAGHVDSGETALAAAIRESKEEVNVDLKAPRKIAEALIHGDSCRRGSDDHKWSLYIERITQETADLISVDVNEGQKPRWADISEVELMQMPYAMNFLFSNRREAINELLSDSVV